MAVTITDTQLQAMADAIMAGESRVTMPDGASIQYRDMDDLMKAYSWAQNQKAQLAGADNRRSKARFL